MLREARGVQRRTLNYNSMTRPSITYDNLLQGPPMSEWAPELDKMLDEIIDEMAQENERKRTRATTEEPEK
jgi:hypothetical protein